MPVRVDLNASSHADTDQESQVQRIRRALGAIAARKPAVFWLKSTRHILFGATSPSSARHEGIKNSWTWALRGSMHSMSRPKKAKLNRRWSHIVA